MALEKQRLLPAERANLVAYLDGELNEAESRAIATKLSLSVSARRELEALEKTWELLDHLPRPQAPPDFASRTLSNAKQLALCGNRLFSVADLAARRLVRVLVLLLSSLLTIGLAYAVARWVWPDPSARLVRQLSLAEHLDEYVDIGSFAFLKDLDDSPEFSDQVSLLSSEKNWGDFDTNERRLRTMPREERLALSHNLDRFNLLETTEQSSAQEIDSRLAQLDSADRTRYLSLLRSYRLWLHVLPGQKQQELKAARGDKRLKLIAQFREEDRQQHKKRTELLREQITLINPLFLFEAGRLLKVWFHELDPGEKAKFDKTPGLELKRIRELARVRSSSGDEGLTAEEWDQIRRHVFQSGVFKKQWDSLKAPKKALAKHQAEARYFFNNEPPPVAPKKLLQFELALPNWFRENLAPLPPEAARWRLTVLYRLVFPAPGEMPDPPAPERPATAPATSKRTPNSPSPSRGSDSAPPPF